MTMLLEQPRRRSPAQRVSYRAAPPVLSPRIIAPVRPPAFGAIGDAAGAAVRMPLVSLLTGNAVNPGEIVQLVIKPSRWFILLNSVFFAAIVVIAVLGLQLLGKQLLAPGIISIQFGIVLIAGRLMWSTVQWMGRYYLLTDQRLIRVCGVFDVDIQSHPLRAVTSIRLYRPAGERVCNVGSLEIIGPDGLMAWQTMSKYQQVHDTVQQAVLKAKQNGCCG